MTKTNTNRVAEGWNSVVDAFLAYLDQSSHCFSVKAVWQQVWRRSYSRSIFFHPSFPKNKYPKVGNSYQTLQISPDLSVVFDGKQKPNRFCVPWFWLIKGKCLKGLLCWKLALKRRSHLCMQLLRTRGPGWRARPKDTVAFVLVRDRMLHTFSQYGQ